MSAATYFFLPGAVVAGTAASAASAVASPAPVASLDQQNVVGPIFGSTTSRQPGGSGIAVASRMLSTCGWLSVGFFCFISAAMPATCGLAIEVPPRKKRLNCPLLVWKGPTTHDPGAATSRCW